MPPAFASNYFALTPYFPNMVTTVKEMLTSMLANGYNFSKGYAFGFSFGAQVLLYAIYLATNGNRILPQVDCKSASNLKKRWQKFKISVCEKAGVGDGYYLNIATLPDPKLTAQFVTCVHTSSDKGDLRLDCNQNWRMGYCGWSQPAAGPPPLGNHGLCPYFWNCAFNNVFPVISNPYPSSCPNASDVSAPTGLRLGYPWKNT